MHTYFFDKFCVHTFWIAPNSIFPDTLIMHLKVIISRIFREKSWFRLATNYQIKCIRKPILANLGTQVLKDLSPEQTVVVPSGETNIIKLFNAVFIRIVLVSDGVNIISL